VRIHNRRSDLLGEWIQKRDCLLRNRRLKRTLSIRNLDRNELSITFELLAEVTREGVPVLDDFLEIFFNS